MQRTCSNSPARTARRRRGRAPAAAPREDSARQRITRLSNAHSVGSPHTRSCGRPLFPGKRRFRPSPPLPSVLTAPFITTAPSASNLAPKQRLEESSAGSLGDPVLAPWGTPCRRACSQGPSHIHRAAPPAPHPKLPMGWERQGEPPPKSGQESPSKYSVPCEPVRPLTRPDARPENTAALEQAPAPSQRETSSRPAPRGLQQVLKPS